MVSFGDSVRKKVDELRHRYRNVEIGELAFQPGRVQARLVDLGNPLILSVLTVVGVLLLFMGMRLGLIVGSVVPMVALTSLALYHWSGGVLQQVSIAAFVISLGMLVDNAIVVSESVQRGIERGTPPKRAAIEAVKDLALPLVSATGTTLAAFLPMFPAKSVTGEFTRALPIIIMLTLAASYIFAVTVTPILSSTFLRKGVQAKRSWFDSAGELVGSLAMRRSAWILCAAVIVVAFALSAFRYVNRRFLPYSDRNQLIIDLKLPEGAHLDDIDAAAAKIEFELAKRPDV